MDKALAGCLDWLPFLGKRKRKNIKKGSRAQRLLLLQPKCYEENKDGKPAEDELDYRNDPSTRTTRSSPGPDSENMIIKNTENEMAVVGDAHIHCNDGDEITINRRMSRRNESDRSGSLHGRSSKDLDAIERRAVLAVVFPYFYIFPAL
jgi:hypothetical protein